MRIARMHALSDREVQSKVSAERCSNLNYCTTFRQGALRNSVLGRAADSFVKTVCLAGSLSPLSPTTQSCATGDFLKVYERPRIGGDLCDGSFSETASLQSAR